MFRVSATPPAWSAGSVLLRSLVLGAVLFASSARAQPSDEPAAPSPAHRTEKPPAEPPQGVLPLQDLRIFAEVFNQIRTSYVEEVDDRTLLENAIKGMLHGLDPHSAYLDKDSFADLRETTTGEFGGVGLEVGVDEGGFVRVIAPIDGTPAKAAGIETGDLIIRLDGRSVKGMSLNDAVTLMRGAKGTTIDLTIVREGTPGPIDVTLTRDVIKVQSVRHRLLGPGYGYLRIAQFQNETGRDVARALERLARENHGPLLGVVLDLRNNPGGVLQSSVEVADAFLDGGLIVYTRGRIADAGGSFRAQPGDLLDGGPVVVLINGGSASASEIVAGALQDHKRAVIVGTDSFGKGSVQTVLPLGEDRAIKLTTARYYTPNGRSIQAQGIAPDIVIERATITPIKSSPPLSEADLSGHLANGDEESAQQSRQRARDSADSLREEDYQLFEAFNLLRGIALLRATTPGTAPG